MSAFTESNVESAALDGLAATSWPAAHDPAAGEPPSMTTSLPTPPEVYADWLAQLKAEITQRRQRAALAVNTELVRLYARIGRDILDRQQRLGWGAKVIDRLARDLKAAFPDVRGFSSRNLKYMAYFAEHCPDERFGQQPAAQLPWFPNPAHAVGAQFIAPNWKHPDASILDDSCTTKPGAMNRAPTIVRRGTTT